MINPATTELESVLRVYKEANTRILFMKAGAASKKHNEPATTEAWFKVMLQTLRN